MPIFIFYALYHSTWQISVALPESAMNRLLLIIGCNILIIIVSMLLFKKMKIISDLTVGDQKERFLPYALVVFVFSITYFSLRYSGAPLPAVFFSLFLGLILSLVLLLVINFTFKISAHMLAVGGAIGAFMGVWATIGRFSLFWFIVLLLLAGLVGSARLVLDAHTNRQVLYGFILGVFVNYFAVRYGLLL